MYRELAVRWAKWAVTNDLTKEEVKGMFKFFRQLGRRFGLINEFKEIGVIELN
jgi:hypothetical protein